MPDFSIDNNKLIKELKKGNSNAYTFLVEKYNQKLCAYAFSLTHDYDLAQDIVQNVFIRLWHQRAKLKNEFVIQRFLYKLIYNEFIDQYRKEIAVTILEKKYIEGLETIIEIKDASETNRLMALVQNEIEQLPTKCKETFLLSKQDGLTYVEIAEYQNVSVNTVEKQMVKAFYSKKMAVFLPNVN